MCASGFRASTPTLARLATAGVAPRNEPMVFHDRKLVFLNGPGDVVVELAEWL